MRTLAVVWVCLLAGSASAADPPAKKTESPSALLEFSFDRTLNAWTTTFEMTTASGATYELAIDFGDRGNDYTNTAVRAALTANWLVEHTENRAVRIYGVRTKEGKADAVKALTITNKLRAGTGQMPALTGSGGAKAEVKTDDGKGKPDPARKVPPKGPAFPDDTFVEFELSALPAGKDGVFWEFTWEVRTTAGKEEPWIRIRNEFASDVSHEDMAQLLVRHFPACTFKAEQVGKTKVRVYGGVYGDRYYPAVSGTVESPHLKSDKLPKVTNPKRL